MEEIVASKSKRFFNKYFADKEFLKVIIAVALPIFIQAMITNFVNMLDNIMVGRIGTEQMSGVAITNQLIFVFNLALFGAVSGVGIFSAQFFGAKNDEGMRNTMRFLVWLCIAFLAVATTLFLTIGKELISLFLYSSAESGDLELTLEYGRQYLMIMVIGLPAYSVTQMYATMMRSAKKTVIPMASGLVAVTINLILNYILIYGKLGAPAMGVKGAAIATVVSRYVELGIVVIYCHTHHKTMPYFKGVYRTLTVPVALVKNLIIKAMPIFVNETLWSLGITMLVQCYSYRGLEVVGSINIANTLINLFNSGIVAMGNAVGIIIGNLLGANKIEEAKEKDVKLIVFSIMFSLILGGFLAIIAKFFPLVYNTNDSIRDLATVMIWITAGMMPLHAFLNAAYFTLRAGGRTYITFAFDCLFVWVVSVPVALILSRCTGISIIPMYVIVNGCDLLKGIIGFILLKKGVWCKCIIKAE